MSEQEVVAMVKRGLSAAVLQAIGFEWAHQSNLSKLLSQQPVIGSGTAIWDSFLAGTQMLLQLQSKLKDLNVANYWKFVHILLTDGSDNSSENSLSSGCQAQKLIDAIIPVSMLKTYFVLVNGTREARLQLSQLSNAGGENSQFLEVDATGIDRLFDKIKIELEVRNSGLVFQNQNQSLILQRQSVRLAATKIHYIVLFNIDVSASMNEGGKWQKVLRGVNSIMEDFEDGDLVAGLVFDTTVRILNNQSLQRDRQIQQQRAYEQEQQRNQERERERRRLEMERQAQIRRQQNQELAEKRDERQTYLLLAIGLMWILTFTMMILI